MNKKIFIGVSTAALLAVSVFAYQNQGMPPQGMMPPIQQQGQCQPMMKQRPMMHHHRHDRFFTALRAAQLTQKQRGEIRTIMQESMQNRPNPYSAFSKKGFDEQRFIKLTREMRDDRIKQKAEVMKKVFNILTPTQKEAFVKQIQQRPMMRRSMLPRPVS